MQATWEKVRAYQREGLTVTLEAWRVQSGLYRVTYDNAATGAYVGRNVTARNDADAIAKLYRACERIVSEVLTSDLIPTNGVHVSESFYPKGYTVARHDAEGLTSGLRWFPTLASANEYAARLREGN